MASLEDAGIAVCTVTYSKGASFAGVDAAAKIQITPRGASGTSLVLVWDATGDTFQSFEDSTAADAGDAGTIVIPQTGQDGFLLNGQPYRDWYYDAFVTSTVAGQPDIQRRYEFQIPAGTTALEIDRLPQDGGPILSPTAGTIPVVTSVNGQSGAVTIDGATLTEDPDQPGLYLIGVAS